MPKGQTDSYSKPYEIYVEYCQENETQPVARATMSKVVKTNVIYSVSIKLTILPKRNGRALQQLTLNVHVKHSDLKRNGPIIVNAKKLQKTVTNRLAQMKTDTLVITMDLQALLLCFSLVL